ncbi:hypothetical protein Bbelb_008440 [Branchiostoma belcheri]|nr:hypothetical protein Bbelb_008440 [Branchiostoma belcheri]
MGARRRDTDSRRPRLPCFYTTGASFFPWRPCFSLYQASGDGWKEQKSAKERDNMPGETWKQSGTQARPGVEELACILPLAKAWYLARQQSGTQASPGAEELDCIQALATVAGVPGGVALRFQDKSPAQCQLYRLCHRLLHVPNRGLAWRSWRDGSPMARACSEFLLTKTITATASYRGLVGRSWRGMSTGRREHLATTSGTRQINNPTVYSAVFVRQHELVGTGIEPCWFSPPKEENACIPAMPSRLSSFSGELMSERVTSPHLLGETNDVMTESRASFSDGDLVYFSVTARVTCERVLVEATLSLAVPAGAFIKSLQQAARHTAHFDNPITQLTQPGPVNNSEPGPTPKNNPGSFSGVVTRLPRAGNKTGQFHGPKANMLAWIPDCFQGLHRPAPRLQGQHASLDARLLLGPTQKKHLYATLDQAKPDEARLRIRKVLTAASRSPGRYGTCALSLCHLFGLAPHTCVCRYSLNPGQCQDHANRRHGQHMWTTSESTRLELFSERLRCTVESNQHVETRRFINPRAVQDTDKAPRTGSSQHVVNTCRLVFLCRDIQTTCAKQVRLCMGVSVSRLGCVWGSNLFLSAAGEAVYGGVCQQVRLCMGKSVSSLSAGEAVYGGVCQQVRLCMGESVSRKWNKPQPVVPQASGRAGNGGRTEY